MTPAILILLIISFSLTQPISTSYIMSQSTLKKCAKESKSDSKPNCNLKLLLQMAALSGSNGQESINVEKLSTLQLNSTHNVTLRKPLTITMTTSPVYAEYPLQYLQNVHYRPEEWTVRTRNCEPDAGFDVVKHCKRYQSKEDFFVQHTEPICCPCGQDVNHRRKPSSCGNIFDRIIKGKISVAHCLRYSKEEFMVFSVGQYSVGFSLRIEVKIGSKSSEVIIGPHNRVVISRDSFLRVNIIGNLLPFESIPSFEDDFLVIPFEGRNISRWMLIEKIKFATNGFECNKIGVSFMAFQQQDNFCSAPYWSCLKNQLWNYWEADQLRISRNQKPLYTLQGRFQRINERPGPGRISFSIGVTEVLRTVVLLEMNVDDIIGLSKV